VAAHIGKASNNLPKIEEYEEMEFTLNFTLKNKKIAVINSSAKIRMFIKGKPFEVKNLHIISTYLYLACLNNLSRLKSLSFNLFWQ
jgi:hypothetical protein